MEKLDNVFVVKFKLDEFLIKKTNFWTISLHPQQPTIGSLVLSLNRKCEKMSLITVEESKDLSLVFQEVEKMLELTFLPDKINYLALMMIDEQVHFHVIPRYSKIVKLKDNEYKDNTWPGPPSFNEINIGTSEFTSILNQFKKAKF